MSRFSQPRQYVSQHQFAMVPASDVPRSVFQRNSTHKTTFNAGNLVPVYCDEVLPGDSFNIDMTTFTRVTPNAFLYPMMDNIFLDCFFFFVPTRLVWSNFRRFMGERTPNTDSSTDFTLPQVSVQPDVNTVGSIYDYFGIPSATQIPGTFAITSLPFRAYNLIWNEWFRDENLQNEVSVPRNDGPDSRSTFTLLKRGKRFDYFTAALPFSQKGPAVTIPMGTSAPVRGIALGATDRATGPFAVRETAGTTSYAQGSYINSGGITPSGQGFYVNQDPSTGAPLIYADLSQATAAHINTMRQAAAMQQYLEKDARGGTRYTEKLWEHFKVQSPDARLQRPEYIGGGTSEIAVNPVAQTSQTDETPLGQLSGVGTGAGFFRAQYAAPEHGYVIGLVSVRADLTYQQGVERFWNRSTVYDFYWPAFAHLGEQAVLRREIYATGSAPSDQAVFGYQPRYDEYRYKPSQVSGRFRSGVTGTLDAWHLAQYFASPPVLGPDFIQENPPMSRVLAGGTQATSNQIEFLLDAVFRNRHVRPMPMYAVPGLRRF